MSATVIDPTSALCEAARSYVTSLLPGRVAVRVAVYLEDGTPAIDARVSPVARPAAAAAHDPPAADVKPDERAILLAVLGMSVEAPSAEEIAEASRLENGPALRKRLASLRRRGLLGGQPRDAGYPLTDLGLSAIDD
jgi:hypothetical protein